MRHSTGREKSTDSENTAQLVVTSGPATGGWERMWGVYAKARGEGWKMSEAAMSFSVDSVGKDAVWNLSCRYVRQHREWAYT